MMSRAVRSFESAGARFARLVAVLQRDKYGFEGAQERYGTAQYSGKPQDDMKPQGRGK